MTLAAMLLLVAIGFCAGGFGALAGVGGGIIVTPLLAIYFGLPMHQAIGVTLLCVIATSTATSSMYVERHVTDVRLGMTLELATTVGALIAALVAHHVNRRTLAVLFACFLLYSAGSMVKKGLGFALREEGRSDPRLHAAELSGGAGGFIDCGRIFRAAGDWRRADQGAGDVAVHESSAARGGGHQQLYDRSYGRQPALIFTGDAAMCAWILPRRWSPEFLRVRCWARESHPKIRPVYILMLLVCIAGWLGGTDDLQVIDRRLPMNRQDVAADRALSLTLKFGAYTAFALILAGLMLQLAVPWGAKVAAAGLLVLLATPVLRIVVACLQFLRERDFKYALVSFGVLAIVVLAYVLGLQA